MALRFLAPTSASAAAAESGEAVLWRSLIWSFVCWLDDDGEEAFVLELVVRVMTAGKGDECSSRAPASSIAQSPSSWASRGCIIASSSFSKSSPPPPAGSTLPPALDNRPIKHSDLALPSSNSIEQSKQRRLFFLFFLFHLSLKRPPNNKIHQRISHLKQSVCCSSIFHVTLFNVVSLVR